MLVSLIFRVQFLWLVFIVNIISKTIGLTSLTPSNSFNFSIFSNS